MQFIDASPTAHHACAEAARMLRQSGFTEAVESASWSPGARHYLIRGGTLTAWAGPCRLSAGATFRLVGAHNDSPNLRIQPQPDSLNLVIGSCGSRSTGSRSSTPGWTATSGWRDASRSPAPKVRNFG